MIIAGFYSDGPGRYDFDYPSVHENDNPVREKRSLIFRIRTGGELQGCFLVRGKRSLILRIRTGGELQVYSPVRGKRSLILRVRTVRMSNPGRTGLNSQKKS